MPWGIWQALAVVAVFSATQPAVSYLTLYLPLAATRSAQLMVAVPLTLGASHAVGWLGAWWLVRRHHGLSFAVSLRLRGTAMGPGAVAKFLVAGMGMQILARLAVVVAPPPPDLDFPLLHYLETGPEAVILLLVAVGLLAPLLEEVLFRGLLYSALRKRWRFGPAALVVTALFAALHAMQFQGYLPALVGIAALGALLAWLRERTGSLWPPVLVHAGFNLLGMLPLLTFLHQGPN